MNAKNERRHMVDVLFVLTLFCVFALCSILLIAVGAKVYQNTINSMETHFTSTTSLSYITEKIRQNDTSSGILIEEFGGKDALVLINEFNGEEYGTYIYSYAGHLKELFTKRSIHLSPEAGQDILEISDFIITELDEGLYEITLIDDEHKSETIQIASKSN